MIDEILENPRDIPLGLAKKVYYRSDSDREALLLYLRENEDASYSLFRQDYITDRRGILHAIDVQKKIWEAVKKDGRVHTDQYFDRLFSLLGEFHEEVRWMYLFNSLEPWWAYSIYVDTSGISLRLDFYGDRSAREFLAFEDPDEPGLQPSQSSDLLKVEAKYLTAEKYAEMFDVDASTVRQWIRRGKLPSAIKYGREWRISELCDVGGRNYARREYFWERGSAEFPDEYAYLDNCAGVMLERDLNERSKYHVKFLGGKEDSIIDIRDRERLEMVLILNPMVQVDVECLANIRKREGQGVYLEPFDGSDDNKMLGGNSDEKD